MMEEFAIRLALNQTAMRLAEQRLDYIDSQLVYLSETRDVILTEIFQLRNSIAYTRANRAIATNQEAPLQMAKRAGHG